MKRSKAILVIAKNLNILNETFVKSLSNCSDLELQRANQILTALEKLGVKPPPYRGMPNSWFRDTGEFGYDCYEWEPEDAIDDEE